MRQTRLRFVAEINPAVPGWEEIPDDKPLTFLPLEAVWPRLMDYSRQRPKVRVTSGYTRFCEGDVIVPKITPTFQADRSTLVTGMPTAIGTGTTELHVIRPSSMIEPRYLDYLVSSRPFLLGGEACMIGVAGQKRVPDQWIRDFPVPVTVLASQRAIADYLDTETNRIDTLITKKRQAIDLLNERRRTLITATVTGESGAPADRDRLRGQSRNPTAPRLGNRANDWRALKHFCNEPPQYGLNVPASDYIHTGTRLIRTSDIDDRGEVGQSEPVYIEDSSIGPEYRLIEGDLLLSRSGTLGRCAGPCSHQCRGTFRSSAYAQGSEYLAARVAGSCGQS